jgi:thiamine biosynthesis lipoprotein
MGTRATIVVYSDDTGHVRRSVAAAFYRIDEIEKAITNFRPDNELAMLHASAGRGHISVGEDLMGILIAAGEMSQLTAGAFDVTVGPLTTLWREAMREGRAPSPRAIAQAQAEVAGWETVLLDPQTSRVTLTRLGTRLDLGGIGKGYAADEAMRVLARNGLVQVVVEIGGDMAIGAPPPGELGWPIGIDDGKGPVGMGIYSQCGLATSGDASHHLVVDHIRLSHIIDPAQERPVADGFSVTVQAPTAMMADALATACHVGTEEIVNLIRDLEGVGVRVHPARATAK